VTNSDKSQGELRSALVERGDLTHALESVDQSIEKEPQRGLLYRERAHLHLYSGQTHQARSDFDTTARLADEASRTRPGRLHCDNEYNAIGVTYWMEEHRELALAFWRYTTRLLSMGRVAYSQVGGGIESGLLLWFGAVHERNEEDIELVRRFYEKRLASKIRSNNPNSWPSPIIHFFLKQIDEKNLIECASDHHQSLCKAHFAVAARSRELGRHAAYRKHLKLAVPENGAKALYDYYNVFPFFLARFELEQLRT